MRAAERRSRGSLLPQEAGPAGCTPHFLFRLAEKKTGRARSKRKGRLGALRCSGPPRATGVGGSVPAPILPRLRARYSLLRGRYCRPVADGAEGVGVVVALPLLLFSLPLAWRLTGAGAAGGCPHPPLRRYRRALRVGADKPSRRGRCPHRPESTSPHARPGQRVAKRNARKEEQFKCVLAPRPKTHRAAGTDCQICTPPCRARRPSIANTQAPSHADPRTATLHARAKLRPKAVFSFGPCTARFLFHLVEKKMGVHLPSHQHGCHSAFNGTHPPHRAPAGLFRDQSIDWRN